MAGFELRKAMSGGEGLTVHQRRNLIITNSATVKHGDAVKLASGFITRVTATGRVFGVVVGLVDKNDQPVDHRRKSHAATITGSGRDVQAAVASDNQTVDRIKAVVITDPNALFYNDANGNFAQADVGAFYDVVAASGQIDQASKSATSGQFQLIEIDPDGDGDLSKGLFKIAESQLTTDAIE